MPAMIMEPVGRPQTQGELPDKPNMIMKTNKLIISLSAVLIATLVVGCGAKTDPEKTATEESGATSGSGTTLKDSANQAVEAAKDTATAVAGQVKTVATNAVEQAKEAAAVAATETQKAVESAKASVANALSSSTNQVQSTTNSVVAQAQALIDKAKVLVTEKKYQDALASLQQLTGFQLTVEQQKTVDELKATIQTALQSDAGKAVQGLFR
jgi:hypothetical protein